MSGVSQPSWLNSYYREDPWIGLDSGALHVNNKAAAATITIQPSMLLQFDTTVGANLHIRSVIMNGGVVAQDPFFDATRNPGGFWGLRSQVECIHYGLNHVNTTVSMMSGMFVGDTMGLAAAVPANPAAFGYGLFSIHNDPGHKWQAWTVNKGGLTWKKTDLVGTQGPTGGNMPRIQIITNPGVNITFIVNGVVGYVETDLNYVPVANSDFAQEIFGIYANSGTNAAARLTCNFHAWKMRIRHVL